MRRAGPALAVGVALAVACAAPPKTNPSQQRERTPVVAPLSGTWMRPIGSGVAGREGMSFAADGSLGLVGIHTMNGLTWRVERDTLIVATNTGRDLEPTESRLHIDELTADRLRLSANGEYLAGTYERNDGAAGRVTGVVRAAQQIALPADAAIHVALWDVSDPDDAKLIANETVPIGGRQVPISFELTYATADIDESHPYAVHASIVSGGELRFQSAAGTPVLTRGHPASVEVVLEPAGG